MKSGSSVEPESFEAKMRITLKCSWRDYHTAVAAKLKAAPAMAAKPWSSWAAAMASTTVARCTKLRGITTYEFDDAGVRRFTNDVEKANFVWADFTHWEHGGNAYWLLAKEGAALVPLRMLSHTERAELADFLSNRLGASRSLSAFDELLTLGQKSS